MREQRAAARGFPFEVLQISGGEGDQHQPVFPGEVAARRLADLRCRGKMNETIGKVDGGARERARCLSRSPFRSGAYLENNLHRTIIG